ncbi:interferon-inducible GTPase 5-like [Polypterus senegalus]|uniref:interferon-inducible GTPase 5-like n=1 Tax=Polypterus senegalus TaxID=55291 RepID=UPI001966100D|nr:interferon-inducible GTPase 5-like [Polypterus senegalus]
MFKNFIHEEAEKLFPALKESGLENIVFEIRDKLDRTEFHIAVTGEAGTGKSAFINAIRGVKSGDPGAAEEGITEQTLELMSYLHPTLPSVYLWDLPGVGTPQFQIKEYLKTFNFKKYHFFLLITGNRFKENDGCLVKEINRMNKDLYLIRSKVDIDEYVLKLNGVYSKREKELKKIKKYCFKRLVENGVENPRVFLVSSYRVNDFDFKELCKALELELPKRKREIFSHLISETAEHLIDTKQTTLKGMIPLFASMASKGGETPIPGTSCVYNMAAVVEALLLIRRYMGLDDESLDQLADKVGKCAKVLKAEVKHPLVLDISPTSVQTIFASKNRYNVLQGFFRFIFIPPCSFDIIHQMLERVVKEFAESALNVVKEAV